MSENTVESLLLFFKNMSLNWPHSMPNMNEFHSQSPKTSDRKDPKSTF